MVRRSKTTHRHRILWFSWWSTSRKAPRHGATIPSKMKLSIWIREHVPRYQIHLSHSYTFSNNHYNKIFKNINTRESRRAKYRTAVTSTIQRRYRGLLTVVRCCQQVLNFSMQRCHDWSIFLFFTITFE